MSLQQSDIAIVRKSWALAAQNGPLMAELFYSRLFRIAPHTRTLFAEDMTTQRRKLVATLGFVVENLDKPDAVVEAARGLAIRHVAYGVKAEQYPPVGEALVWALHQVLGGNFGSEEEGAWVAAYATLSGVMIETAYGSQTTQGAA